VTEPAALTEIVDWSSRGVAREVRATAIATAIRAARDYRWVGLYDVADGEVAIVGWAGGGPPSHPRFPWGRGLASRAIATRATVLVNDVAADDGYLEAVGDTCAELIVPIVYDGSVLGTIDVESEHVGGFEPLDAAFVERCAAAARPLWSTR
jgi:GAF domain-containing protein